SGLQPSIRQRREQHAQDGAVLERAARVEALHLRQHLDVRQVLAEDVHRYQGRVADRAECRIAVQKRFDAFVPGHGRWAAPLGLRADHAWRRLPSRHVVSPTLPRRGARCNMRRMKVSGRWPRSPSHPWRDVDRDPEMRDVLSWMRSATYSRRCRGASRPSPRQNSESPPSMKRDVVQEALKALAEAARRPDDEAAVACVRDSLTHRSNHLVARASRAAREADLMALTPDLIAAFPRFLEDPVRRDPGCVAKTEIVRVLLAFGHAAPDVYLRGAAHVQREPAFGPPIDTAPELRALSAMALVVTEHPAALTIGVGLLVDPEPVARAGGLRALAASGRPDIALLMRLYALRGDSDPGVLAEAFLALLALAVDDPVPFVVERLASADRDVA